MERPSGIDSLAQVMADLMAQGLNLAQVSVKVGLPPEVCHTRMTRYLEDQASSMSIVQLRMLQLRRFEFVIQALWDQVMAGDLLTQGRNTKNLIDTINSISDLMDLKKDRLRDEQVRLTQAQTQMVLASIDAVRMGMLEKVIAAVGEDRREAVNEMWHGTFSELAAAAVEENAEAVVRMGSNAGPVELLPSSAE